MSNNSTNSVKEWDTMSLQEQEVFIARSALELINSMFDAGDSKGLDVLTKNLSSLQDFAKDRLGLLQRKENIADSLKSMLEHLNTSGIDEAFAEGIDNIASLTTDFMSITGADGSDDFDDDQAYCNIQACMQKEVERWEAEEAAKSA